MEKKIRNQRIIILLLTVMLVFNFITLINFNDRLDNFNNSLNNGIQTISSSISSMRSQINEIRTEEEKQLSLITSFDYQYGELDESRMVVPVKVKIVPKSVSNDTVLTLEFGSRTVEMKKSKNSTEYTAEFESGLFEHKQGGNVRLVVAVGSSSETEELDWSIGSLHTEFLPFAAAHFAFDNITCSEGKGVSVEGDVISMIDNEDAERFTSAKLLFKINGEVLSEDVVNGEKILNIDKTFPGYGIGDTFELCLEAVDEFGFTHEALLKRVQFGADGELSEEFEADKGSVIIKDKQGNVLYS